MFLTIKVNACVFTQLTKEEGRIKKKKQHTTGLRESFHLFGRGFSKDFKMFSQLIEKTTQVFFLGKHGVLIVSHFMMVVTTQAGFVCLFLLAFQCSILSTEPSIFLPQKMLVISPQASLLGGPSCRVRKLPMFKSFSNKLSTLLCHNRNQKAIYFFFFHKRIFSRRPK